MKTSAPDPLETLPPSMIVCNCAKCGRLLRSPRNTGSNERELKRYPPFMAGRIWDRPFCRSCAAKEMAALRAESELDNRRFDDAIRHMIRASQDADERPHRLDFRPPGMAALYDFDLDDVIKSLEES